MIKILRFFLIILLFLLFAAFLIHNDTAIGQDLGRHLKTGEIIFQTKTVPKINLYSYTQPEHQFINTHWLSEVIFYGIFSAAGFAGLTILKTITILLSFLIIFSIGSNQKAFWLNFILSFLTIGILLERTDVRPEIFSFLILAIFLALIFKAKKEPERYEKWLWLLPLLQLFWTNLHIYFFVGPALYGFFFLEKLVKSFKKTEAKQKFSKFLFIGFLISIATFINPNGAKGALYPLKVMSNYGYSIIENQTPFFLMKFNYHPYILFFFFVSLIILIAGLILNLKKIWHGSKIFEPLLTLFVSFLGLYALRNFPIFALSALPLSVQNFSPLYFKFSAFLKKEFSLKNLKIFEKIAVSFITFILGWTIYYIASNQYYLSQNTDKKFGLGVNEAAKKAVDFVVENKIEGRMFNNYDLGGYLIWRLYPEKQVFVDNRPEAYSPEFFQSVYIPMQNNPEIFRKYAADYDFNLIFFERTDITPWAQKFLGWIEKEPDWAKIYSDKRTLILIKRNQLNQPLIDKFAYEQ